MNEMKKDRILHIVAWFAIISALALMGLFIFWAFYPYKIVEYYNLPYPINNPNKEVNRGDYLFYTIDYCKHTNDIPTVTKYFIDEIMFQSPDTVAVATSGCRNQQVTIYVPKNLPPAVYKLRIAIQYKVNPIRTITYTNETETFTVK